jgi:adenine-specific DNA-methyltransferase
MIYSGKSIDVLKTMEENSVDCVITDPPYQGFEGMESPKAYCDWFAEHFVEMQRVCRAQESIVVSQWKPRIELFRQRFKFQSIIKLDNAMQDERGQDAFFLCQTETAPEPLPAVEQWPADIVPASSHPNDRNIGKMAVVVKAMSNVGDIVLDPFCGSAAIGVACILLGRKYIGIELLEDRAKDARKRIEAAQAVFAEKMV